MINSKTGQIESATLKISPKSKVQDFNCSDCEQWEDKEGHLWERISLGEHSAGDITFIFTATVKDNLIYSLDLCNSDSAFGESWSEWSKEKELARKQTHDQFLRNIVGSQEKFSWGSIYSVFDEKAACSYIGILYNKE